MATVDPDTIAENAAAPKRASADGTSAEQHSIPDQIAADKYAKSQTAAAGKKRGFRLTRLKPPGAV